LLYIFNPEESSLHIENALLGFTEGFDNVIFMPIRAAELLFKIKFEIFSKFVCTKQTKLGFMLEEFEGSVNTRLEQIAL
jgi:hypothetical protein